MELVAYIVPLAIAAVSLPMIRGKVPPNETYGFRTHKTLSSEEIWYPANRAAGWFMIAAAGVSLCFNHALLRAVPEWPLERMLPWMVGGVTVPLLLAVGASLLYLRRL